MTNEPITYDLTDADHRQVSASFGVEMAKVPIHLTGGCLEEHNRGVMFLEMIEGHRISLAFSGRPVLARAASAALAQTRHTVA